MYPFSRFHSGAGLCHNHVSLLHTFVLHGTFPQVLRQVWRCFDGGGGLAGPADGWPHWTSRIHSCFANLFVVSFTHFDWKHKHLEIHLKVNPLRLGILFANDSCDQLITKIANNLSRKTASSPDVLPLLRISAVLCPRKRTSSFATRHAHLRFFGHHPGCFTSC